MSVAVRIEPGAESVPDVEYRWDPDTDILTAHLRSRGVSEGMSGSLGFEGGDGSWVIFDVCKGRVSSVEIAVWPDVRKVATLTPPAAVEDGQIALPSRQSQPGIASVEADVSLVAEADAAERTFHFRFGEPRRTRTLRLARDLLLDIDPRGQIAGLWMLNVPPFPADS